MSTTTHGFDMNSGIRERLALLAEIGPKLAPDCWGYHTHRDYWYYCGGAREIQGKVKTEVKQEGQESLRLIQERWNMDRKTAMAFIGYPDKD